MSDFKPKDPNFKSRVADSFHRQAVMRTIGAELTAVTPGRVAIGMSHAAELTQQHGFLHAGIVATALDSACGYAAFSLMPADAAVLTIEFKVNLLAPAEGKGFSFEAEVVKPGRTIMVSEGRAYCVDGGARKLLATMTATIMVVSNRAGLKG